MLAEKEEPAGPLPVTPAALQAVCLKTLAKKPEDRYASARELAEEVQRWLADEPLAACREPLRVRAGRWVRRHRTKAAAAVAAVVVAAACLRKKWLQTAVPFYEELVEQQGNDPHLEADRGGACFRLALLRAELDEHLEAVAGFEAAQAIFTQLNQDNPAVPRYRQLLASSRSSLGVQLDDLGRREEAGAAYRKALALFEGLARDFPAIPEYRQELVQVQVKHSVFLARMGKHTKAVAEANVLAEPQGVKASTLYSLSCVFSLCSAAVKIDAKLADQYATRGVELLRQAVAKGFKDVTYIKKDTDLDPLRSRDDFKKLLSDLEKAIKPAPAGTPK